MYLPLQFYSRNYAGYFMQIKDSCVQDDLLQQSVKQYRTRLDRIIGMTDYLVCILCSEAFSSCIQYILVG